ncbi:MAG: carboxypeptidase regulatory-like domain-containing protein [Nitrososphaerota archaeon]|nr:carboxypeptidase regulatory-like domain-containing protein [Nitrososphaerota archaeon]MDG6952505.1 carboxypeptidase regulatory-like domain-containing protein [Nitrososphaerota archaeon]
MASLLILAGALQFAPPAAASGSGSVQTQWQQPYYFRKELTVSNPGSSPLQNYPVLLNLNFSQGRVFSGRTIRLFNSTGDELPTYLVDQQGAGGYVTSVVLLAFVTVPARSSISLWAYYGSVQATPPPYRLDLSTGQTSLGPVAVDMAEQGTGSAFTFTYGRTYSETVEPVVGYGQGSGTLYGPSPLAELGVAVGWHVIGNQTSSGNGVILLSSSYAAGGLRYRQVEVVSNSSLVSVDEVTNVGPVWLSGVSFSLAVDASQLASVGPLALTYNASAGSATASVGGAFVGFSASPLPSSHTIGPVPVLISSLAAGRHETSTELGPPTGVLLSWPVATLGPGHSFSVETVLSVSSRAASIEHAAQPPTVHVGPEQSSQDYLPTANGLWGATVSVNGSSVSASGVSVPLEVSSGVILPDTLSLGGTVSYTWPSPDFGGPGVWNASTASSGNATAYASSSFFSVGQGVYLGRVASYNYGPTGSSNSSLSSTMVTVVPSSQVEFTLAYKATFTSVSADPIAQQFYAALRVYNGTQGSPSSIIYFPVAGSSEGITSSPPCGQSPSGGSQSEGTSCSVQGPLVADGTWRTMTVDLNPILGSGGFGLQMFFGAFASEGFVGQMDLQVESAQVSVTVPAQSVVEASLPSGSGSIGLAFVPGELPASATISADLAVGFDVVSTMEMLQDSGSSFGSPIPEPMVAAQGVEVPLSAEGIVVYTRFASLGPTLSVNGTGVQVTSGSGVISASGASLKSAGLGDPPASAKVVLRVPAEVLTVNVTDASGTSLSGAAVTVVGLNGPSSLNETTGATGVLSFGLIPWNYTVSVISKGSQVYSTALDLTSNQTVQAQASVYAATIKATSILGAPLGSALVVVSGYGYNQSLSMSGGSLALQLPAGQAYHLTIVVAGNEVYEGLVTASSNGATILVRTSYALPLYQIGTAAVAATAVFLVGMVLYRRKGKVSIRLITGGR